MHPPVGWELLIPRAVMLTRMLALLPLCTSQGPAVLSPAYMGTAGPGPQHCDVLATLATAGLANRDHPALWLNSSSKGWVSGFPAVMWPYPQADRTWIPYLEKTKGVEFEVASDAELCTLLSHARIRHAVKGLIIYEESATLNALKWAAVSAAGQYDGIPATHAMLTKHACLAPMPVLFTIPPATNFADDLAVYAWMAEALLPKASTKVLLERAKAGRITAAARRLGWPRSTTPSRAGAS